MCYLDHGFLCGDGRCDDYLVCADYDILLDDELDALLRGVVEQVPRFQCRGVIPWFELGELVGERAVLVAVHVVGELLVQDDRGLLVVDCECDVVTDTASG